MPPGAVNWFAETLDNDDGADPPHSFATVECANYAMLKRIVLVSDSIGAAQQSTIRGEPDKGAVVELPLKAPDLKTVAGIV